MRYRLMPQAQEDLTAIGDYIAAENPAAALKTIDLIHNRLKMLTAAPFSGSPREDIRPGMRMIVVGWYVVLYRVDQQLEVVRILHGRRRIGSESA